MQGPKHRFFDIAANLTDDQFGSKEKQLIDDRVDVVGRARAVGCSHLLIAAGCISDALLSHKLCHQFQNSFLTIGVHPCRASEPFDIKKYPSVDHHFIELEQNLLKVKDKLVAIGECGLDYDRLNYASKEQQLQIFPAHFALAKKYDLPMYLHNRNTGDDFFNLVQANRHMFKEGVVHSFTGNLQELDKILKLGLYVGINGCSLKTMENISVLRHIPLDRIMLETDSPYCEIRASSAASTLVKTKFPTKPKFTKGFLLKGRNQPCRIIEVLEAVSSELKIGQKELSKIAFENSLRLFKVKDTVN